MYVWLLCLHLLHDCKLTMMRRKWLQFSHLRCSDVCKLMVMTKFSPMQRETWWRHFGGSRLMRLMRRGGGRIWGRNSSRCLGWVPAQASFANFNAPPLSTPRAGKILLESNNSESYKIVKKWHLSYVAARVNELKCESKDRATVYIFLFLSFV